MPAEKSNIILKKILKNPLNKLETMMSNIQ